MRLRASNARLGASLVLAFVATAGRASAAPPSERAACIAAAERGQKSRKEGLLPDAQKDFLACARAECPAYVRTDCAQWVSELAAIMPSIVIAARMDGKDLFDVRVSVDGQVVTERLDGKPLPMAIGEHSLRFEYAKQSPVETRVLMREGDKNRAIDVTFGAPSATEPPKAPAQGAGGADGKDAKAASGHTVFPWIVAGVGAGVAVTGAVLFIIGNGKFPAECNKDSGTCSRGADDAATADALNRAESSHSQSNLGLGLLIGGGVVAVGGLAWHFLESPDPPKKPKDALSTIRFSPSVSTQSQTLLLTGQF